MSAYDLIPDEAYDNLPDEPADKFVALTKIAQTNLQRLLDSTNSSDFADELRSQFMAMIQGAADALGIEGLTLEKPSFDYNDYIRFQVMLAGITSRVRLIGDTLSKPHSVELGRVTRAKIRQEVEQLRVYISDADLTDAKKSAMNDKLDELLAELDKRRLSFARTMAVAASIMGVIGGSAGALAAAPKIPNGINFIIALVGQDKEREDEERARLSPPPAAIAPPTPPAPESAWGGIDLDDDVPF